MNTLDVLRHQFAYNEWANRLTLDSLEACPSAKAVRAFAHLLIAEKMWLVRLLRDEDTTGFDFWQGETLDEGRTLAEENRNTYGELLGRLVEADLDNTCTYRNSRGVEYTTSYRDVLTHVLFHSAYHRGQSAAAVRADG